MPERGWPARRPLSASAKLRKRLLASSSMRFCGALSVRPAKAAPSVPHCFLALCPVLLRSVRGTKIVTNETEPQTRTAISGGRAQMCGNTGPAHALRIQRTPRHRTRQIAILFVVRTSLLPSISVWYHQLLTFSSIIHAMPLISGLPFNVTICAGNVR